MTLAAAMLCGLALVLLPQAGGAEPLPSGTSWLSPELQALQADAAANPGMLWVDEGAALWQRAEGKAERACADCHGRAEDSMRGVATRYPAVDPASGALLNLEARINRCRSLHQLAPRFPYESDALLGLTAYVAHQSKGLPLAVEVDGPARPFYEAGRAYFERRRGQMNLSCAQCHDDHAGRRLRGDVISHGLGNAYPAYRLEWQAVGSLHRRFRSCAFGVRAVRLPPGAPDYLNLELYLAKRAEGVPIETPGVRN